MKYESGRMACSAGGSMEMHIQNQLEQLESIRRGFVEIEAGHYIPHEAMKTWLLSLRLDRESPPPLCVCDESHDEPA
jgi:predicted transcriptional regulator